MQESKRIKVFEGRLCVYDEKTWRVLVATPTYLHLVDLKNQEAVLFVPYWEVSFV